MKLCHSTSLVCRRPGRWRRLVCSAASRIGQEGVRGSQCVVRLFLLLLLLLLLGGIEAGHALVINLIRDYALSHLPPSFSHLAWKWMLKTAGPF